MLSITLPLTGLTAYCAPGKITYGKSLMTEYRLRLVGNPMGPWIIIEAPSPTEAITKATGCGPQDVRGFSRPRVGTERYGIICGGTFQDWDIEETCFAPIIARLALAVGMYREDIITVQAKQDAVEEVVNATGMRFDDANRLVRIWLATMESRGYDTVRLHADE
jgi:hypothetical protein